MFAQLHSVCCCCADWPLWRALAAILAVASRSYINARAFCPRSCEVVFVAASTTSRRHRRRRCGQLQLVILRALSIVLKKQARARSRIHPPPPLYFCRQSDVASTAAPTYSIRRKLRPKLRVKERAHSSDLQAASKRANALRFCR